MSTLMLAVDEGTIWPRWQLSSIATAREASNFMNDRIVLVVEDDPFVRMDAVDMIVDSGFRTLEAGNADDAIAILEQRSDICVVFTDVQMPGSMDGLKLAAAIHDRWPPIKIIATSGQFTVLEQQLPDGGRFIPKPYSRNSMGELLEEVLAH